MSSSLQGWRARSFLLFTRVLSPRLSDLRKSTPPLCRLLSGLNRSFSPFLTRWWGRLKDHFPEAQILQ